MSNAALAHAEVTLPFYPKRESAVLQGACLFVAALFHAALVVSSPERAPASPQPIVTEIDLAPPKPIEPPPEPPKPVVEEPRAAAPTPQERPTVSTKVAAGPAAARAGALLTLPADAAKSDSKEAPVEFVTDPNGQSYGGGVVARGGTADFGARGAQVTPTTPRAAEPTAGSAARKADDVVAAADLSAQAKLTANDACRGYFPSGAESDNAVVALALVVRSDGRVGTATVLSESPASQGFGAAARTCMLASRFSPGLDKGGMAVTSATTIRVRFTR
ncbi:MAG: hypothetical protein U0165_09105 [Polyangiaceae bacterium]